MKKIFFVLFILLILLSCKKANFTEINFAFYDTKEASLFIEKKINEFNKNNPEIRVNRIDIQKKDLIKNIKTKTTKANLLRYSSNYLQELSDKKIIINFEKIYDDTFYNKFQKGALLTATYKKRIWGIPDNYGNHFLIYYNKKILHEMPETSDELIKAIEKKIRYNNDLTGIVFNQKEPEFLFPWFYGFNLDEVFNSENHELNKSRIVKVLDFIYNLKFKYNILPYESDYEKAEQLFLNKKAALIINGDWAFNYYKKNLLEDLGVSDFPVISLTNKKPISWASTNCYSITKNSSSKKKTAAISFINFMISEDVQREWLDLGRLPSINSKSIIKPIEEDPLINKSYQSLLVSKVRPLNSEVALISKAIRPYINQMLEDKISPQTAANEIEKYYEKLKKSMIKFKIKNVKK